MFEFRSLDEIDEEHLPDSGGGIKGTIEETPRRRKRTITGLMGQVDKPYRGISGE